MQSKRSMVEIAAQTERLILRTWDEDDGDRFYEIMNTPMVMRWLGGVQDKAEWDAALERLNGYQREFGHTFWLIEDKSTGDILGFCGLKRVNAPGAGRLTDTPEIGWRLRDSAWGQGIAKHAAIASLDIAFGRFAYDEVVALTVPANAASQGLMKRLGMRRREELDYIDTRFGPELNPSIVYSIAAEDWPAARAAALA